MNTSQELLMNLINTIDVDIVHLSPAFEYNLNEKISENTAKSTRTSVGKQ